MTPISLPLRLRCRPAVARSSSGLTKAGRVRATGLFLAVALGALAEQALAQTEVLAQAGGSNSTVAPLPVEPFKYVPSPRWKEPDPSKVIKRSGAALEVEKRYREQDYEKAGLTGLELIAKQAPDEELRLYIANSLAWTNHLKEAITLYEGLMQGEYQQAALLGLANIHRWQGNEHLAIPMYKKILKAEPDNKDAKEGLRLALREVRPRATVRIGGSSDSSQIDQFQVVLNQRWRDETYNSMWEIETSQTQLQNTTLKVKGTDLTLRYRMLASPLKPSFEVGVDKHNLYGGVTVELDQVPLKLNLSKVNWGRLSANPLALSNHLSATRLGAQLNLPTRVGQVYANADFFKVSDGNTITTGNLRLTPSWQPIGPRLKFFTGIETRSATFYTLNYWSPANGYGSAFLGMQGDWGDQNWSVNASAQVGTRLYGEAGRNWSVSLTARRWLSDDVALGLNLWVMQSVRDAQQYRVRSLFANIEKLW